MKMQIPQNYEEYKWHIDELHRLRITELNYADTNTSFKDVDSITYNKLQNMRAIDKSIPIETKRKFQQENAENDPLVSERIRKPYNEDEEKKRQEKMLFDADRNFIKDNLPSSISHFSENHKPKVPEEFLKYITENVSNFDYTNWETSWEFIQWNLNRI